MKRKRSKNVSLVAAMARVGMTGQALAHRAGVHPITISAIINNRVEPKLETQRAIASVLNISRKQLFQEGGY